MEIVAPNLRQKFDNFETDENIEQFRTDLKQAAEEGKKDKIAVFDGKFLWEEFL